MITPPTGRSDDSHLMPGDEHYHHDKRLVAKLADLNGHLTGYLLRHLDADAKRTTPISPDDEHDLGTRLVRLGMMVIGRADRRQRPPRVSGSVVDPDVL